MATARPVWTHQQSARSSSQPRGGKPFVLDHLELQLLLLKSIAAVMKLDLRPQLSDSPRTVLPAPRRKRYLSASNVSDHSRTWSNEMRGADGTANL